jgi:hypothetical protein
MNDKIIKYKFLSLMEKGEKWEPRNLQRCFEVLGLLYLEGGIREDSEQIKRNKWSFQQLERSGLLAYSYQNNIVVWHITKDMVELNRAIVSMHGLSMEDYLIPIFLGEKIKTLERPDYGQNTIFPPDLLNKLNDNTERQLIQEGVSMHEKLMEIDRTHDLSMSPKDLVELCLRSLGRITKFYLKISNIKSGTKEDMEVMQFWKRHWFSPPSPIELLNQMTGDYVNTSNYIFSLYRESFGIVASFIKDEFEKTTLFSIDLNDLTSDDAQIIHKSRDYWSDRKYFESAVILSDYVEKKLRVTLFNLFYIMYGPRDRRERRIDSGTRERMKQNKIKDDNKDFSRADNEMQYLDRKDYKNVMLGETQIGKSNWAEIFRYIFL